MFCSLNYPLSFPGSLCILLTRVPEACSSEKSILDRISAIRTISNPKKDRPTSSQMLQEVAKNLTGSAIYLQKIIKPLGIVQSSETLSSYCSHCCMTKGYDISLRWQGIDSKCYHHIWGFFKSRFTLSLTTLFMLASITQFASACYRVGEPPIFTFLFNLHPTLSPRTRDLPETSFSK